MRELSKLTELSSSCQARSFLCWRPLKLVVGGRSPRANFDRPRRENPIQNVALRKISKSDQQTAPEPLGLTGDKSSWVLQCLVLCGVPYSGSGATASPDPTNSITTCFPLPSSGRPIGHREALYCNFLRVAHTTPSCNYYLLQAVPGQAGFTSVQLAENSNDHTLLQAPSLWKARFSVGNPSSRLGNQP